VDVEFWFLALVAAVFAVGAGIGAWIVAMILGLRRRWEHERIAEAARRDALAASRRVLRGQVSEQFAPYLDGFGFDPADARFVGNPIDFVVFDGLAAGDLRAVVLVEVKSGRARLNDTQRLVRDGIVSGEVPIAWREVRLPGD
jgi:predicted Holliday junction resolvase-like endonuclease